MSTKGNFAAKAYRVLDSIVLIGTGTASWPSLTITFCAVVISLRGFALAMWPHLNTVLGHYLIILGKDGAIIELSNGFACLMLTCFRFVVHHSEYQGELRILSSLRPLLHSTNAAQELNLTEKAIQQLKNSTRFVYIAAKILSYGIGVAASFILGGSAIIGSLNIPDTLLRLYFVSWSAMMVVSFTLLLTSCFAIFGLAYIAVCYLKLRLHELQELVTASEEDKDSVEFDEMLIVNYSELFAEISAHGRFLNSFSMILNYVAVPYVGILVFLTSFVNFQVDYIREMMLGVAIEVSIATFFMSFKVSEIYSEAQAVHSTLNSIFLRKKLTRLVKLNMTKVIKRIGSDSRPVSIYCGDFFAFTPMSSVECVLSAFQFYMLAAGFVIGAE